jgi:glycine betaine catabolism A
VAERLFKQGGVKQRGTPAPVDPVELAESLRDFGKSRMLPRSAYVDPDVFAWESANIFAGWICVGFSADLPNAGDQRAVETADGGVLFVRGDDGVIRAFANVCRHRGHQLLACGAEASKRTITCPYHGWTYRSDGSLHNAPRYQHVPDFDPDDYGLIALPLEDWHGWLFVDPSGQAGAFADVVGDVERVVAPYKHEQLRILARHDYEVASNWKVLVENYQECYHCPLIHPELCRVSPPTSGGDLEGETTWMGGWMDLRDDAATMSLDGRSGGTPIPGLDEVQLRTVMYLVGYPNVLISLHPDYVMTHVLTPIAADRTRVTCAWAFPPADAPGFDPSYAVDFWDLTNRQDWSACEGVQLGLSSPHAVPGPIGPDETGVHDFVHRVATTYAGKPAG